MLRRIFGYGEEPKATRAHLGQENSMYYDPVEKRWREKDKDGQCDTLLQPPPKGEERESAFSNSSVAPPCQFDPAQESTSLSYSLGVGSGASPKVPSPKVPRCRPAHVSVVAGIAPHLPRAPRDMLEVYSRANAQGPLSDVSSARFFDEFMADPAARNSALKREREEMMKTMSPEERHRALFGGLHHPLRKFRQYDFRLNEDEQAVFRKHGFVVSERLQAQSFAEVYYRVYTDDLPVFVSADSVLHAWHRSFDAMLNELEEQVLARAIGEVLHRMSRAVQDLTVDRREDPHLVSADVFLTVAAALLDGQTMPAVMGAAADAEVSKIMKAIEAQTRLTVELFGVGRETDFSMMRPRGRYTRTPRLQRYFRCLSWLGRADLRVEAPDCRDPDGARAQLACALTLLELAHRGGVMQVLETFDDLIRRFVGERDCAGLTDLAQVCVEAGVPLDALTATSPEQTERVYNKLMESQIGAQQYGGDIYYEDTVAGGVLPRSICMMGQRFILDAWMMTTLVYDGKNELQARRIPSALDVAFGALGNNAALPHLVGRMERSPGSEGAEPFVPFRDGVDYAKPLVEARHRADALQPEEWASSIYTLWLASLRALSAPHPWISSADCLGTPAWQAREMNTQLASWTQLRHDTVLYAKQGFTCSTCCEYPAGLVEPRPFFWQQMKEMSMGAAAMLRSVPEEVDQLQPSPAELDDEKRRRVYSRTPKALLRNMAQFLDGFGATMGQLGEIAEAQLARHKLADQQEAFLKRVMEERHGSGGSRYMGWYPQLFYTSREDSGKREVLVTDVHTDAADPTVGDPGYVLHEGVGNVHVMFLVADTSAADGGSRAPESACCYAGPVFSHYEFLAPSGTRLTDEEWQDVLDKGDAAGVRAPAHPVWTQPWLVSAGRP